jgi:predicted NACHT family NTPase
MPASIPRSLLASRHDIHPTPRSRFAYSTNSKDDKDKKENVDPFALVKWLLITSVLVLADLNFAREREQSRQDRIYHSIACPCHDSSGPGYVPRHSLERELEKKFTGPESTNSSPVLVGQYDVVTGKKGSGKTTLVKKVASETKGVVYFAAFLGL